jgi:hypothetical protein
MASKTKKQIEHRARRDTEKNREGQRERAAGYVSHIPLHSLGEKFDAIALDRHHRGIDCMGQMGLAQSKQMR